MTQSLEDYLKNIYFITNEKKVARVKDISEKMRVKKPSVINAVKELQNRGLVIHERYGYIDLTDEGLKRAQSITQKMQLVKRYLVEVLKVSEQNAEKDSCEMEHFLSKETLDRIAEHFQQIKT